MRRCRRLIKQHPARANQASKPGLGLTTMTLSELERVEIALRRVLFEEQDAPLWVGRLVGPDPMPPYGRFSYFRGSRLGAASVKSDFAY